jgi:hypothetical protein
MQVSPDYTTQLQAIAGALQRPQTASWLVALVAAVVGSVFTVGVQLFLKWWDRWHAQETARCIVYREISDLFIAVDSILKYPVGNEPWIHEYRQKELAVHLKFDGEMYLRSKPDVFMRLQEKGSAEMIYRAYHEVLGSDSLYTTCDLASRLLAGFVKEGRLEARYFRKYLGAGPATVFLGKLAKIQAETEEMMAVMLATPKSGDQ